MTTCLNSGHALQLKEQAMKIASVDKSKLAQNGKEYIDLVASGADWVARTKGDLYNLRENEKDGPFAKLPDPDFHAFVSSLQFANEGGVASGCYKYLMSSLTLTELFAVFERFGMSREYFSDSLEEKCVGGEWNFSFWNFCSSLCAHVKKV
ncbi:hypothetical protein [Streptomyces tubercidicus]|uniref:hypothetical protein n=1 Tax=Streptomyces tubercidicus TaxID=47759 RepID=UPI003465C550